MIVVKRHVCTF